LKLPVLGGLPGTGAGKDVGTPGTPCARMHSEKASCRCGLIRVPTAGEAPAAGEPPERADGLAEPRAAGEPPEPPADELALHAAVRRAVTATMASPVLGQRIHGDPENGLVMTATGPVSAA
jgi:hypothetical protein